MAVPLVRLASGQIREEPGTFATIKTGELAGAITATRMPDITCYQVKFKALVNNDGNVYIGGEGVTVANGTTDTTSGWELDGGQETEWLRVDNLNVFYRICTNDTDDLVYMAMI